MADQEKPKKERGPKGGIKHTPGRGHRRKSGPQKAKRFEKQAARKRRERVEAARREWQAWDSLTEEQRKLLGKENEPKMPRPKDED